MADCLLYGDQDAAYMKCQDAERQKLVGPTAEYYRLIRGENVDPLYDEPSMDPLYGGSPVGDNKKWVFADMVEVSCIIEYQEKDDRVPSTRDEGLDVEWDAIMGVSQNNWDEVLQGIEPKEGDVTYVFDEWFTVVNSGTGGNILDTPTTVGWELKLKKRSRFTPDRKVNR